MKKSKIVKSVRLIIPAFALILTASTLVFLSGCKDEDGDDSVETLIPATYQITSAVLNEATPDEVPAEYTGGAGQTVLPEGTNVTPIFVGVLACAGPCDQTGGAHFQSTAIQLTNDKKMLYVCTDDSADPDETGTWLLSQDGGTLTISIVTEVGGNTVTVPLNVTDFTVNSSQLSGTIENFSFFPSAESGTGLQTVSMDVTFAKI